MRKIMYILIPTLTSMLVSSMSFAARSKNSIVAIMPTCLKQYSNELDGTQVRYCFSYIGNHNESSYFLAATDGWGGSGFLAEYKHYINENKSFRVCTDYVEYFEESNARSNCEYELNEVKLLMKHQLPGGNTQEDQSVEYGNQ
ncbi:MAG: hypothetical protein ACXVCY_09625 [Pseudobdellovibrionaceae bacterium]